MRTITLIPGDGIGPEVIKATTRCIEATGAKIKWEILNAGESVIKEKGTPLPDEVLESIRKNKVALKGPITTPVGSGFRSVNVAMRKQLDLYACLRPYKLYPGVQTNYEKADLVIVRENTEDLYAGIEFQEGTPEAKEFIDFVNERSETKIKLDSGISLKPNSRSASERIVKFAFEYAKANGRKKVTAVHKANIMKFSDGLFLETARKVAENYKEVEYEDRIVDNMCMQLVQKPEVYDVIVAPNLYGDLLSDLCAGIVGGLGVAPGANIGDELALFEPTHGSAPKYAGKNKVNPLAAIISGIMMLRHIGEEKPADELEKAMATVIREGKSLTYDMKPTPDDPTAVGTSEVADAIIEKMGK